MKRDINQAFGTEEEQREFADHVELLLERSKYVIYQDLPKKKEKMARQRLSKLLKLLEEGITDD